jgi:hypothetical protein
VHIHNLGKREGVGHPKRYARGCINHMCIYSYFEAVNLKGSCSQIRIVFMLHSHARMLSKEIGNKDGFGLKRLRTWN